MGFQHCNIHLENSICKKDRAKENDRRVGEEALLLKARLTTENIRKLQEKKILVRSFAKTTLYFQLLAFGLIF